jgi:hypothetical protein
MMLFHEIPGTFSEHNVFRTDSLFCNFAEKEGQSQLFAEAI